MSSVHGYLEQCALFLQRQIEIIRLSVVVALGVKAESYVSKLDHPWMKSRHPTDWHFRERITREKRLKAQGGADCRVSDLLNTDGATTSPFQRGTAVARL